MSDPFQISHSRNVAVIKLRVYEIHSTSRTHASRVISENSNRVCNPQHGLFPVHNKPFPRRKFPGHVCKICNVVTAMNLARRLKPAGSRLRSE